MIDNSSDDPSDYEIVADNDSLAACCREWSAGQYIALDSEFIRTNTFYPKVGLLQVCDESRSYLIDPLAVDDWDAFRDLMEQESVVKIFHSCSEDLLVFFSFLGIMPRPIFDTQIAAAFLDHGQALSYQALVRKEMGIELPKGETRSDWLQRPLSGEQLQYAALDVAYLPEIYRLQHAMLRQENKLDWLREECARALHIYDTEVSGDFSDYYRNIKGAWQLNGRQLAALRDLAQWREQRARRRNRPRNWIVRDPQLLHIARALPQNREQLAAIDEINDKFVRHEGDAILKILDRVRQAGEETWPDDEPRPLSASQKKRLKAAQHMVQEKAEALRMPPDLLARKRAIMVVYNSILGIRQKTGATPRDEAQLDIPAELRGWRRPLVLEQLIAILGGEE